MGESLLVVAIEQETDVVLARQRTRQLTELLGFDKQDQTRITTAVSEIARNAFEYCGNGRVGFFLVGTVAPQLLEIVVSDSGPGIPHLDAILDGAHRSSTGMGVGIRGARRLVDQFKIETTIGAGTTVKMRKMLPGRATLLTGSRLETIRRELAAPSDFDPLAEIRRQNRELLESLQETRRQHEELSRLNQELEDTNRGVVALYAELDERADHLRRADELKTRFLSDMSHEFRTPLNSIMALSRLLLDHADGDLSSDQEKQLTFIRSSAEDLTELVNDLLDLAKVEAGKVEIRPVEFSVGNLFSALRGMLRPLLAGDRVSLVFDDVADVPDLFSDESKVAQILRNLISNAIKFTERGEVRVFARMAADDTVLIGVRDTGIGIAPESQDAIFQEFVQLDSPAQRNYKGTGLGLPLSKRLAALLGGSIELTSAVGAGSTFTLRLPRAYRTESQASPQPESATQGVAVLALEDNATDMYVYERMLAETRFDLLRAHTVAEARKMLAHTRPAAILLDLVLFGEDSWRFLARLKDEPETRDIPVIIISSVEDEAKAHSLGAEFYFRKPIERTALLEILEQLMHRSRRTRVLLVEDEAAFRYVIRQFLPVARYEVIDAHTGRDGLRAATEMEPEIILLDVNLPGMGGFEVLDKLSTSPNAGAIPVIIVTAQSVDPIETSRFSSIRQVIAKRNLSTEVLTTAITNALEHAAKGGTAHA